MLLLAAGETFVIVTGGIDLSVGFVMGFVGVVAAIVMRDMFAAGSSQAVCMIVGAARRAGRRGSSRGSSTATSWPVCACPPFIATLGMYGVANGLALNLSQGFPIYFLPPQGPGDRQQLHRLPAARPGLHLLPAARRICSRRTSATSSASCPGRSWWRRSSCSCPPSS